MPYINQSDRKFIEPEIGKLVENILELSSYPSEPGLINYVLTSIVTRTMSPIDGWNYRSLSRALAVFRDAEAEMRRRLLDPYEDKAIAKNGDIPEYESPS